MGDAPAAVRHGDEIRDRVERVLELAPRANHVIEQLHVLDRARELTSELFGAGKQGQLAARLEPHRVAHDRSQRPPRAAQRDRQRQRNRFVLRRDELRAGAAHRRSRRRERIVCVDTDAPRDVLGVGRGAQHEMTRTPIVNPNRGAVGAKETMKLSPHEHAYEEIDNASKLYRRIS